MCLCLQGEGEKYLLKKIRELQRDLSHNSQWWTSKISLEFLTHLQKATPEGFNIDT